MKWQIRKPEDRPPPFEFPPDDLMISLIDLFFTKIHLLLPILHRPSFLKSVAKGLHHEDRHFGGLVLAICALGARFSDDPRVFEEHTSNERSIGWKWIRQIEPIKGSFTDPPTIHEIQLYTVCVAVLLSDTLRQFSTFRIIHIQGICHVRGSDLDSGGLLVSHQHRGPLASRCRRSSKTT